MNPRSSTPYEEDFENDDPMVESDPVVEAQEEVAAAHEVLDVVTREHRRISRDLHDSVGQELTGLRYMASNLAGLLRAKGLEEAEIAELVAQSANEAQRMLRRAIKGVLPAEVSAKGLPKALAQLAAQVRERYGVDCICKAPEELELPSHECAGEMLKIAQEACRNAAKHAQARQIALRLTKEDDGVSLVIENDGQPIDLDDRESATGIGLQIMRSRAKVISAQFQIEPLPAGGTRVAVFLPSVRSGATPTPSGG